MAGLPRASSEADRPTTLAQASASWREESSVEGGEQRGGRRAAWREESSVEGGEQVGPSEPMREHDQEAVRDFPLALSGEGDPARGGEEPEDPAKPGEVAARTARWRRRGRRRRGRRGGGGEDGEEGPDPSGRPRGSGPERADERTRTSTPEGTGT